MGVKSPGEDPFSGSAYLVTILVCSHQVIITWEELDRTLLAKRNNGIYKVIQPRLDYIPW
jgi:hypothetical protein